MFSNLRISLTPSERKVLANVLRPNPNTAPVTVRNGATLFLIAAAAVVVLAILAWFAMSVGIDDEIVALVTAIANAVNGRDVALVLLFARCLYLQSVSEARADLLRKFYAYLSDSPPGDTHS